MPTEAPAAPAADITSQPRPSLPSLKSVSLAPQVVEGMHPDDVQPESAVRPEKKERKRPERTKEEVEEAARQLKGFLFENKKIGEPKEEPKEEPKAEEEQPKEEEQPVEEPKKEEAPKPKTKVTKRPKREPVGEDEIEAIAKSSARAAVEAVRASEEQKKPAAVDDAPFLSDSDKRKLEVLKELEESNERYVGYTKKFTAYKQREAQYKAAWEKENPGLEFDPDADEHESFYAKHAPDIDQDDYTEAVASIKARKLIEKERDKLNEKQREIEQKLIEKEIEPIIQQRSAKSIVDFVSGVDESLGKLLIEKGAKELAEENPLAFEVMDHLSSTMLPMVQELAKLSNPKARYQFNPKNQIHAELNQWVEAKYAELAEEERDGKRFVPYSEYTRMSPLQRRSAWTVPSEELPDLLVQEFTHIAKAEIAQREEKFQKYMQKRSGAAKASPDQKAEPAKKPAVEQARPTSPAGNGGGVTKPKLEASAQEQNSLGKEIRKALWGD